MLPDDDTLELNNIKDDIVLIQFKLVKKDTLKVQNTFSFINVPETKYLDANYKFLSEIVCKFNSSRGISKEFLPYNKSILTRIVYDQIKK